jgi:hypothetical protein
VGHVVHSGASRAQNVAALFFSWVAPLRILQKVCRDMLCQTSVFASDVFCESQSAFRYIRGVKYRCTIFHAQVGLVRISQNARWHTLH